MPNYSKIKLFHLPNKVVTAKKSHWIENSLQSIEVRIQRNIDKYTDRTFWMHLPGHSQFAFAIQMRNRNRKRRRRREEWHSMRAWALCPQFHSVSKVLCDCQRLCLNYHKIITMKNQNFRRAITIINQMVARKQAAIENENEKERKEAQASGTHA